MASDSSGTFERLIGKPVSDLSLPSHLNPKNVGPLDAILGIIVAGVGSVMTAVFIGIASIPTGVVIAIRKLLAGLRTFAIEFVQAFLAPFEIATTCLVTAGGDCSGAAFAFAESGAAAKSAGIAGFVLAVAAVGASLYAASVVVSRWAS